MQARNHNNIIQKLKPQLQNLKTRFNRGAKNHNRASKNHDSQAQKHNNIYAPVTNRYSITLALFTVMFTSYIFFFGNAYAEDTITITLPSSSVNLPITPTSSGTFNSTSVNVQVTTSNTAGYTLSMTAADVNLTRTAAVNGSTPTIPTFTSLSGYTSGTTYSQANFPTGYWGYKLSSDTNYSPISSNITIADPDESIANTAISNVITFAAKLDNSKPAGSYTTTLTFTATGKTPPITLISFTINGTTYQAEDGMTWAEWVNSDYNVAARFALGVDIDGSGKYVIKKDSSDLSQCGTTTFDGITYYNLGGGTMVDYVVDAVPANIIVDGATFDMASKRFRGPC